MEGTLIIVGIIAFIVIIFALNGLKVVPQSETKVIERLGKFQGVLPAGLNIIWPIIDRPKLVTVRDHRGRAYMTSCIDLREQVYDFPKQNVITKDNVTTEINALLYFQIVAKRSELRIVELSSVVGHDGMRNSEPTNDRFPNKVGGLGLSNLC